MTGEKGTYRLKQRCAIKALSVVPVETHHRVLWLENFSGGGLKRQHIVWCRVYFPDLIPG